MFARYLPGTMTPGPFQDLGNCPQFTLNVNFNKFKTYDSIRGRIMATDEIKIASDVSGSIVTDDLRASNIELWFGGDFDISPQGASGTVTATYPLERGANTIVNTGERHIRRIISVVDSNQVPWIEGIDYSFDMLNGLIQVRDFAKAGAAASITVSYVRERSLLSQMKFDTQEAEGELRFVSYNPLGPKQHFVFPRAKLYPSGDFALTSQDEGFATLGIAMTSLLKPGETSLFSVVAAPVKVISLLMIVGTNLMAGEPISFVPASVEGSNTATKITLDGTDITRFLSRAANTFSPPFGGTVRLSTIVDTGFETYEYWDEATVTPIPTSITWSSATVKFSNTIITNGTN